jgi:transcriptional regulator with XRE-family HTH domain
MTNRTPGAPVPFQYLGLALRSLRNARHLDLTELAEQSGLSTATLSRYETGHSQPNVAKLVILLQTLGTDEVELLREMEKVRSAAEGRPEVPLHVGEDSGSFETRLLAAYLLAVERGVGETWLEQLDAGHRRVKEISRLVGGLKEEMTAALTAKKPDDPKDRSDES